MLFPHSAWRYFSDLINQFDFAVRSLPEFVDYQLRVVSTKVMETDSDQKTDRALQVALAISGAKTNFVIRSWLLIVDYFKSSTSTA